MRKKLQSIKNLKKSIWSLFSEWVRRNEKGICWTCGDKKHWKEMQAGHYIHNKLDFDPINVHCQCVRCNHFLSGNLGVYGEKMIKTYGQDVIDDLRRRSNVIFKPSRQELEEIKNHWKDELKILELEGK